MEINNLESEEAVKILIIDDDRASQVTARMNIEELFVRLKPSGLVIKTADTIQSGLHQLTQEPVHIVFLDKDLGKDASGKQITGIDYIKDILAIQPFSQVIMLTGDLSYKEITKAMKAGAHDYLLKSNDPEHADYRTMIIHQAVNRAKEALENMIHENQRSAALYGNYACESPVMQRYDQKIEAMSESPRPILLQGASGIGKGATAMRINEKRKLFKKQIKRRLVNINFASLSDEIAQSDLFGHEANSFTGAGNRSKAGLLDAANGGDIFMDEIGDASPALQLKLLKVVEEGFFTRVGGTVPIRTNACFIFATNKDLKSLVEAGKFRYDLYYRISAFEIEVPPLEERKADLPAIIKGIIRKVLKDLPHKNVAYEEFPEDLVQYLTRDNIPGNIRGIENDVNRIITFSKMDPTGVLDLKDWRKCLGHDFKPSRRVKLDSLELSHLQNLDTNIIKDDFPGLRETLGILERKLFQEAKSKNYTLAQTAEVMKISKAALYQRTKAQDVSFAKGKGD
jgi:two-component system nitrogen regulation response regulator GlnG